MRLRGGADLQPVRNLRIQVADMFHSVIEDVYGLRGREGVLRLVSGRAGKVRATVVPAMLGTLCVGAPWRGCGEGRRRHEGAVRSVYIEIHFWELLGGCGAVTMSTALASLSASGLDQSRRIGQDRRRIQLDGDGWGVIR